jgi:hypothetical protein
MTVELYAALNFEHRLRQVDFRLPHVGAWMADVVTDDAIAPSLLTDGCTLSLGEMTMNGSIVRAEAWQGTTRARIVAGKAGWQRHTPARYYSIQTGVRRSIVLADLAAEVGETMAPGLPDSIMAPWYVRQAGPASWTFQALGLPWRVLDGGETSTLPYPAGEVGADFVSMGYDAHLGIVEIATEALEAWRPNRTFTAPQLPRVFTVDSVIHRMTNRTLRSEIWVR